MRGGHWRCEMSKFQVLALGPRALPADIAPCVEQYHQSSGGAILAARPIEVLIAAKLTEIICGSAILSRPFLASRGTVTLPRKSVLKGRGSNDDDGNLRSSEDAPEA
jgi:hypothetical protein